MPSNLTLEWANVSDQSTVQNPAGLSPSEIERATRIAEPRALAHFLTGCRLIRSVVHRATGVPPETVQIDRTCPDCGRAHGRPRVKSLGPAASAELLDIDVSVSHAGDWAVAVAVACAGAIVGIDIEVHRNFDLSNQVPREALHPNESCSNRADTPSIELLRKWVRKESLVKATGEGIRIPLSGILLFGRELLAWDEHPEFLGTATIDDIETPIGIVGAVAVLR